MAEVEVMTRVERRRNWGDSERAALLAELDVSAAVPIVARRHGIAPSLLYGWRAARKAKKGMAPSAEPMEFMPIGLLGRQDWRSEALLERIARHPERNRRLFLIRDAGNLDHAYRPATALIMASQAEGFGLPIVEAFQRGLPVLRSDIPVFREVAGASAAFFTPDDLQGLAALLRQPPAIRAPGRWLTWRDSADHLVGALAPTLDIKSKPEGPDEQVP